MLWRYKEPENLDDMTVGQLRQYQMNQLDKAINGWDTLKNLSIYLVVVMGASLIYIASSNITHILISITFMILALLLARIFHVQKRLNKMTKEVMLKIFIENGISETDEEYIIPQDI